MATQFFLRDAASDLGGAGQKLLSKTRGASAVSKVTNSVAAGTNIQVTDTAGGQALTWFTPPLNGVTISGTVTVNLRGLESAAADNGGGGILVERTDGSGNVQSAILVDVTVPSTITEYSSVAESAKNGTYTPTSTTLNSGDRIKVTLKLRAAGGTMGAGTVQNFIDGPTAAASGDCYVTFTEAIGIQVSAAGAETVTATGAATASSAKPVTASQPVTASAAATGTSAKPVTASRTASATTAAAAASAKPVSAAMGVTAPRAATAAGAKPLTAASTVTATRSAAAGMAKPAQAAEFITAARAASAASSKPAAAARATAAVLAAASVATRHGAAVTAIMAAASATMTVTVAIHHPLQGRAAAAGVLGGSAAVISSLSGG